MEELFWGLLGLGVVLLPLFLLIRSVGKISRLERDMLDLRGRVAGLERTQTLSAGQSESNTATGFAAHQLSTLIDLETLKQGVKGENEKIEEVKIEEMQAEARNINEQSEEAQKAESPDAADIHTTYDQTPESQTPTKTSREWEAFIGGRLFNRIGAAAIILGIGFFLKYAFDNDLIPEWLRVVLGLTAGAGLIVGAIQAQKRDFEIFAQGLVGAGLGTLYLSVYATYNFYHLVSIPVAFGGMIAVTALGFVLALIRFDSLAIALIAWFGGFITPLLFHTETPNVLGLFAYLLFLNCGLLALVFMRDTWFVLKPLSFIATYGIAFLWYTDRYTTLEHFSITTTFAVLYWAVFFLTDSYRAVQGLSKNDALWRKVDSSLNSSVSYAALFALVYDGARVWMPLVTILYASAYFLVSQLVRRREPDHTFAFRRYSFTAITYLFLATAQQFSREMLIITWSLEFAVIFFLAWRMKEKFVMGVMLIVGFFIMVGLVHLKYTYFMEETSELKPLIVVAYCTIIAAFLAVAVMVERFLIETGYPYTFSTGDGKQVVVGNLLHYTWGLQAGYFFHYLLDVALRTPATTSMEAGIFGLFGGYTRFGIFAIANILFFLFFALLGRRTKWREITHISLGVLVIFAVMVARGFAYEPATAWQLLLNIRVGMLLTGTAAVLVFMRLWGNDNPTVPKFLRPYMTLILSGIAFLLVFTLLTGEASDFWHIDIMRLYELPEGATTLTRIAELENGKQLSISLVWLVYAIALMAAGLMRHARTVRVAALGLAGLAVAKIFLYDLSFLTTPYRIGSFIGLGLVLMLVSFLYQRFKHIILED